VGAESPKDALADFHRRVGDNFGAGRQVNQPPERDRVLEPRGRPERPGLEPGLQRVDLGFEFDHLPCDVGAVEQHRAVGQVDGQFARVFHQYDRVDRSLQIVDVVVDRLRRVVWLAGQPFVDPFDPVLGSPQDDRLARPEDRLVVRVQLPAVLVRVDAARGRFPAGAVNGDDPDARRGFEVRLPERDAGERGPLVDVRPDERLDGFGQCRPHRVGQSDVLEDDLGDVARGVAYFLCGTDHAQHRRESLCVVRAPGGHHETHPGLHLEDVHPFFERHHLGRQGFVAQQHRRVRQVDQQFGGVFHFGQHRLDADRFVSDPVRGHVPELTLRVEKRSR